MMATAPGQPGGPPLDVGSLPVISDGPNVKPQASRSPGDEYMLLVASYNQAYNQSLPTSPDDPLWGSGKGWRDLHNAFAKTAVDRTNAYKCASGQGHCHHPGFGAWLSRAVKAATKVLTVVFPVPALATKLAIEHPELIPIYGQVAAKAKSIGMSIIHGNNVLSAAQSLLPPGARDGFEIGAGLMTDAGLTSEKILQARSKLTGLQRLGFDSAISTQSGMATARAPASLSAQAKAGYYITQGMQGSTNAMKRGMLKQISRNAQARIGVEHAAKEIASKSLWIHIKEYFGFYELEPHSAKQPRGKASVGLELTYTGLR